MKSCHNHNSVMKSWLDGRGFRKHKTTYLSPRSQTEYVSHSDELSVALRFINAVTSEPEE